MSGCARGAGWRIGQQAGLGGVGCLGCLGGLRGPGGLGLSCCFGRLGGAGCLLGTGPLGLLRGLLVSPGLVLAGPFSFLRRAGFAFRFSLHGLGSLGLARCSLRLQFGLHPPGLLRGLLGFQRLCSAGLFGLLRRAGFALCLGLFGPGGRGLEGCLGRLGSSGFLLRPGPLGLARGLLGLQRLRPASGFRLLRQAGGALSLGLGGQCG
ncbi:MAG: hypothetical protein ACK4PH_29710, partial [Aquincola tertiaricarbonis]